LINNKQKLKNLLHKVFGLLDSQPFERDRRSDKAEENKKRCWRPISLTIDWSGI